MFIQNADGGLDEVIDERTGQKPKKYTVSKDERGFKRVNVPMVMMDQDNAPARSIEAIKDAAWKAMVERVCNAWKAPMHVLGSAPATQTPRDDGAEDYVGRDGYVEWQRNAWRSR